MALPSPVEYWDRVAEQKCFTHPLDRRLLARHIPAHPRILDFGCGYGRIAAELMESGYTDVVGVDLSAGMIRRGRRENSGLDLRVDEGSGRDGELGVFDAVILFSVWTCIPEDEALEALMRRIRGLLREGGVVYVSDLLIQGDRRNQERYEREEGAPWGVLELGEGVRLRHFRHRIAGCAFQSTQFQMIAHVFLGSVLIGLKIPRGVSTTSQCPVNQPPAMLAIDHLLVQSLIIPVL